MGQNSTFKSPYLSQFSIYCQSVKGLLCEPNFASCVTIYTQKTQISGSLVYFFDIILKSLILPNISIYLP